MGAITMIRLKKFQLHNFSLNKPNRFWFISLATIFVFAIAIIEPAYSFLGHPQGDSILYGKVADTRHWAGVTGDNLLKNAKVTINSSPAQTTYTDEKGQFWFNGLRDIPYSVAIDTSDRHYSFSVNVDGTTGSFFDLAAEEHHNLKELDY
ncbi:carboxypeptidase-like regulatory domain-containing protein [Pseudanabaena sp. 'Roaring Creek']|uniref:carboxypeptidase-like regulatory domain-containing protein n=1 Tax=Pseudanabaena sp. 'Roaring Creek' TaxID=1681830 RepID=UPI0006D823BD|nr:carboxypeptidase-like regulatory domain-containing protein [Pseudanabaena sp. 'Roaring Creek']